MAIHKGSSFKAACSLTPPLAACAFATSEEEEAGGYDCLLRLIYSRTATAWKYAFKAVFSLGKRRHNSARSASSPGTMPT